MSSTWSLWCSARGSIAGSRGGLSSAPLQARQPPVSPELLSDSEEDLASSHTNSCDYGDEYRPLLPSQETTVQILAQALNPLDYRKWRRKPAAWRALKVFKLPVEFLLLLTVPVVDPDRDDKNWKRPLNCLQLVLSPLVVVLTLQSGEYGIYDIGGLFPVWTVVVVAGTAVACVTFFSTSNSEPPRFHWLFAFLGFLTSALWINAAATEVVNILRSLGVVFRLSNTVLGLTLLAWGNSIGAGARRPAGVGAGGHPGTQPGGLPGVRAAAVLPAEQGLRRLPAPLLLQLPAGGPAHRIRGDPLEECMRGTCTLGHHLVAGGYHCSPTVDLRPTATASGVQWTTERPPGWWPPGFKTVGSFAPRTEALVRRGCGWWGSASPAREMQVFQVLRSKDSGGIGRRVFSRTLGFPSHNQEAFCLPCVYLRGILGSRTRGGHPSTPLLPAKKGVQLLLFGYKIHK
ncbi:mitochondrial sodium/calcium exchanger protein isoform X2 [Erinaceus europaeus]|uniref:Mitochondrial sodium/calcium exchanger protein isoform X2 n=1 Tax=Erinaceus europaeus TaxID=9365 RepID=A0ABM3XJM3_ERIEU|nr:mitochondrial sodium/calcium exchanger protein isoform X2 [Erinaceus europaeus]